MGINRHGAYEVSVYDTDQGMAGLDIRNWRVFIHDENLTFREYVRSRSPSVCERPLPCEQLGIVPFLLLFSETLSRGGGYNRGVIGNKIQRDRYECLNSRVVNRRAWSRRGGKEGRRTDGAGKGGSENLNGQ